PLHTSLPLYRHAHPRDPPPFPTRRSSDLRRDVPRRQPPVDQPERRDDEVGALRRVPRDRRRVVEQHEVPARLDGAALGGTVKPGDRKSTRLNSSHDQISYAVFCLKKKKLT